MKIIKEGKKKVTARRLTCNVCDCVFEYNKLDLHSDPKDLQPFVYCPCCGTGYEVPWWKDYE